MRRGTQSISVLRFVSSKVKFNSTEERAGKLREFIEESLEEPLAKRQAVAAYAAPDDFDERTRSQMQPG